MIEPSDKQIRYAWFLHKQTKIELYKDWRIDRGVCGDFIRDAKAILEGRTAVKYTDAHIERILSGGELKNDPGPWDEEWCKQQQEST